MPSPPDAPWLAIGMVVLSLAMIINWTWLVWKVKAGAAATRFAGAATLWAAGCLALGAFGVLSAQPRLLMLLMPCMTLLVLGLARSRLGQALSTAPLWLLVLMQSFRLPLELLMHEAAKQGVMPPQMSFGSGGMNYDILTGVSGLGLGLYLKFFTPKNARTLVALWNVFGTVLLVAIVVIAVLSTPLVGVFAVPNTWIFFAPYVWLPAVLVASALLGHALIFRRLVSRG